MGAQLFWRGVGGGGGRHMTATNMLSLSVDFNQVRGGGGGGVASAFS